MLFHQLSSSEQSLLQISQHVTCVCDTVDYDDLHTQTHASVMTGQTGLTGYTRPGDTEEVLMDDEVC